MSLTEYPALQHLLNEALERAGGTPLAVFDCDGTVIRGDIGEAMLYRQIEHFYFRISPAEIWEDFPRRDALARAYAHLQAAAPGARTAHPDFAPFADMILSWYFGQIEEGLVEKACADIVRLFAGFAPAEVRKFATDTFMEEANSPVSERRLGSRTLPRGVRFLLEPVALVRLLRQKRVQVWAVSGSSVWSVEPVFHMLGVPRERVIGIDLEERNGVFTGIPHEPIPIREKKVDALRERVSAAPILVASDSRNDIPLLEYSVGVKVMVNSRNRSPEVFFKGGKIQRDKSWVVIDRPTTDDGSSQSWQTFR